MQNLSPETFDYGDCGFASPYSYVTNNTEVHQKVGWLSDGAEGGHRLADVRTEEFIRIR
jgi:hypothetical protein